MVKNSYQIQVKAESRKKWMKFLRSRIKDKYRHRVKILCFPGPEALEIFEVYDKLGIPRHNITCLERDREAYEKIQKLNLGCNLVLADLYNYVKTNEGKAFDVISLDFTGQLGSCGPELFILVRAGFLSEKSYVFTNFSAAREQDYTKAYYLIGAAQYGAIERSLYGDEASLKNKAKTRLKKLDNYGQSFSNQESFNILENLEKRAKLTLPSGSLTTDKNGKINFDSITDEIQKNKEDFFDVPVKTLRDVAVWHMVREALINGRENPVHKIAAKQFFYIIEEVKKASEKGYSYGEKQMDEVVRNISEVVKRKEEPFPDVIKQMFDMIILATLKDLYSHQFDLDEVTGMFKSKGQTVVKQNGKFVQADYYSSFPVFTATNFFLFQLYEHLTDSRYIRSSQSYKYVSDNGMPMFCDMFELGKNNLEFLDRVINIRSNTVEEMFDPLLRLSKMEITNILKQLEESCLRIELAQMRKAPVRIDLGRESSINPKVVPIPPTAPPVPEPLVVETDSYLEQKKAEALAYKTAMPELNSKDIAEAIDVNSRKVAAWLAHFTMGTYKKRTRV